jgi:hypothetical protein
MENKEETMKKGALEELDVDKRPIVAYVITRYRDEFFSKRVVDDPDAVRDSESVLMSGETIIGVVSAQPNAFEIAAWHPQRNIIGYEYNGLKLVPDRAIEQNRTWLDIATELLASRSLDENVE